LLGPWAYRTGRVQRQFEAPDTLQRTDAARVRLGSSAAGSNRSPAAGRATSTARPSPPTHVGRQAREVSRSLQPARSTFASSEDRRRACARTSTRLERCPDETLGRPPPWRRCEARRADGRREDQCALIGSSHSRPSYGEPLRSACVVPALPPATTIPKGRAGRGKNAPIALERPTPLVSTRNKRGRASAVR